MRSGVVFARAMPDELRAVGYLDTSTARAAQVVLGRAHRVTLADGFRQA
jgi:hypothetical protein